MYRIWNLEVNSRKDVQFPLGNEVITGFPLLTGLRGPKSKLISLKPLCTLKVAWKAWSLATISAIWKMPGVQIGPLDPCRWNPVKGPFTAILLFSGENHLWKRNEKIRIIIENNTWSLKFPIGPRDISDLAEIAIYFLKKGEVNDSKLFTHILVKVNTFTKVVNSRE